MPLVSAAPPTQPFPEISFSVFSMFIEDTFGPKISLATVLLVLFSMTENPELLSLHARQQHPSEEENKITASGWIRSLSRAMMHRLQDNTESLFRPGEFVPRQNHQVSVLSTKLDKLATLLNLTPYDSDGKFQRKLLPPSYTEIQAVHVICPSSTICVDKRCARRALLQNTRPRDIPLVTLIKDNIPYADVPVLSGKCIQCGTTYYADHERFKDNHGLWTTCYLNSARYLKVGQALWVDRNLSHSILSGMYNFHASASAFTQFWNDCNSITISTFQITRRQIWHAFVQESLRTIASIQNINLELREDLNIHQVVTEAFAKLGNTGIIAPGKNHSCAECSQPYKHTADFMANEDPAAVIGADENSAVPVLTGEFADLSVREAAEMRAIARNRANNIQMDVDEPNADNVKMIVLDGVVIAPMVNHINYFYVKSTLIYIYKHCSHAGCTKDLKNARGGAFCHDHELSYGDKCRIIKCERLKVQDSPACQVHQAAWRKYKLDHSRSSLQGVRRMLQRPGESHPWQTGLRRTEQPHDNDNDEEIEIPRVHYFGPAKFYCVETICAPCGVVIAWTKFDKSESPTRILNFLQEVYPTEESRPAYICIDKACRVLRTSIISHQSWNMWKKTSRFIVDSYHYINHRTTDYLCRKWCNPGPLDGSAPNLVKVAHDKNGRPYLQRAFNTQVWYLY